MLDFREASDNARVAKLADARDLKSLDPKGLCGFDSRPGHSPITPARRQAGSRRHQAGSLVARAAASRRTPKTRALLMQESIALGEKRVEFSQGGCTVQFVEQLSHVEEKLDGLAWTGGLHERRFFLSSSR